MKFESNVFDFHGIMRTVLDDLKLDQIAVVYPGIKQYSLDDKVVAVPLKAITEGMKGLFPK